MKIGIASRMGCQMLDFGSQNLQNISKIATKINPKSMKNRGCVFGAFLGGRGAENGQRKCYGEGHFGSHFRPKIENWHPKRHPKIDTEKVLKNDAKMMPK